MNYQSTSGFVGSVDRLISRFPVLRKVTDTASRHLLPAIKAKACHGSQTKCYDYCSTATCNFCHTGDNYLGRQFVVVYLVSGTCSNGATSSCTQCGRFDCPHELAWGQCV